MPDYHLAVPYASEIDDPRVLPRIIVGLDFLPEQLRPTQIAPIVDSGAEISVIDGRVALIAGLSLDDIIGRAQEVWPIRGIGQGATIRGYLHEVTCYVGTDAHYSQLRLRVLITPPDTIRESILGRDNFFRQVDVTFVEAETMIYLRFRDPSVIQRLE